MTDVAIAGSDSPGSGDDTRRVASEQRERWRRRLDEATVAEIRPVLDHYGVEIPAG